MSSYQALLSLSPAEWIGAGEFAVDDDDDGAAAAAVSSYLSFDDEEAAAPFHSEPQQAPDETLLLDTLQTDYYCASGIAGSSSEGETGKQSHTDAAALTSHSHPHDNGFTATSAAVGSAGAGSLLLHHHPATAGRKGGGGKVAFKTRSEVEVLDDGYRWRKYGKKLVKDSPNPRNYYRCSTEGCAVKKRVERARDDASFVITTYDGVHNHPAAPAPHHRLRDYRLFDPPPPAQGHRGVV